MLSIFIYKRIFFYYFKIINADFLNKISQLSMGPFFLHYLIIWTLSHLFKFDKYSLTYRFFGSFIISFLCFIITAIIKKIPIIRNLTP